MAWFLSLIFELLLIKDFDKTTLPNSTFQFNSSFLVPFNDFICEMESTSVFEHLWLSILKYLWEKQPARLNCLQCIEYIVTLLAEFLKNLSRRVIFSNFAGSLLWNHAQILSNLFGNFGRIFFQAGMIGCFIKERMLNKQECASQLLYISENIKAGRFSSRDKVFMWKLLSRLCRDPALNKWDFS